MLIMTVEKMLENKLRVDTNRAGGIALKLWPISFLGLPDRMVLMPKARVYFVELKSTGEEPKDIQLLVHTQLRQLGFEVYVIDNLSDYNVFKNHALNKYA